MSNRCAHTDICRRLLLVSLVVLAASAAIRAEEADIEPPTPQERPSRSAAEDVDASPTDAETQPAERPAFHRKPLPLPEKSDGKRPENLMSELLAMVVVILLLGIVTWIVLKHVLPRLRGTTPTRNIRIIETTNLNSRQAIVLIEVGQRRLLLASTRERVSMLADVSEAGTQTSSEFAAQLAQAEDARQTGGDE
jgi:flagellar biogenesis protein FliO